MIVYPKQNFAFQHINRCGGMSVVSVLDSIDSYHFGPPPGGRHKSLYERVRTIELKRRDIDWHELSIYANVRDPFSRLVSIFTYRGLKNFEHFINHIYCNSRGTSRMPNSPIEKFVTLDGEKPENVTLIKIEDSSVMWPDIIKKHFGITINAWPVVNTSSHGDTMSYYNYQTYSRVYKMDKWIIDNCYPEWRGV